METTNQDEMETVKTGNGFTNDLLATVADRLKKTVIATRELKSSVDEQKQTIIKLDGENDKTQKKMLYLTIAAIIIALMQLIPVIDTLKKWLNI